MRNKILAALTILCILSLGALLTLAVCVHLKQYQDINVVMPDGSGLPPFDLKEVNELSKEGVAVTYDIRKRTMAHGVNYRHPVMMVETNSSYRQVLGLKLVAGSFWSDEDWERKSRFAVLNEPAAFRLFGSGNIIGNMVSFEGKTWTVTGIVKDGDKKNPVVYVPASAGDGTPEVLLAKTSDGKGAVQSGLRRLGIYESNSRIVDVSAMSRLFWQLFCVSACIVVSWYGILLICKHVSLLKTQYEVVRRRYEGLYMRELIMMSQREFKKIAIHGLIVILSLSFVLLLARWLLMMALMWMDLSKEIKYLSDYFFQGKIQWLMRYLISGPLLFMVFVVTAVMILVLKRNP